MNHRLIVIVGFMGSGKTAVAQQLGRLLNEPSIDLDVEIEDSEQRTPAQIITEDGEQAFRDKETQALRELVDGNKRGVVALGGGAWTIAANRELIRSVKNVVVWLDAQFDLCWQRIEGARDTRPMAPTRLAAQQLLSERLTFYRMADLRIDVSDQSPTQIAENIAALLQQQPHK